MIEINLVPDVKQELIKAQRVRAGVISMSIFASLIALGLLVVLLLTIFGVQAFSDNADKDIKTENDKILAVPDLSKTLTIQNQLTKLSSMHSEKLITSRIYNVIRRINPPAPNNMTFSTIQLSTDTKTVNIEGFATGGYSAVEIFKKTIEGSKIEFKTDGKPDETNLANIVDVSETSFGESSDGSRVVRFVLSFEYPDELLARSSVDANVASPTRENATDSYRGLPQSMFGDQAADIKEEN